MVIKGNKRGVFFAIITACFLAILTFQCEQKSTVVGVPDQVDFNFHVKPILVQNCYLCHGPDPSSRKADLRLDTYEGAIALRDNDKFAIVPGSPGSSELVHRISSEDPDFVMPPPETNLKLTEYEIEVLRKWVDQGAEWKPHWAFILPDKTEPESTDSELSVNQIDDFVLNKVLENGLEPAKTADKHVLIRRVSYILTGLPPTAEELNSFIADQSDQAYEKMVDHYLNSGGFGERWARHWLDIVRYAETKGHEFDYPIIGAWRYRDYLIRAFNNDLPYDQFVKEHLAGDLLDSIRWNPENGINESQIGTAFYALGEGTHSPVDIKKDEADRIDNMIDVTTKAFQGLTVSCARCHDHKFDPIPTADYYALYGVMESSRFSAKPANLTYEVVNNLTEIQSLKNDIRSQIANNWDVNLIALQDERESISSDSTSDYKVIGDFRGQDLQGWKSDGLAFGDKSTLGEPGFDIKGNLVALSEGKASSRSLSTGIYGALRSPNFIIEKDFIGVLAKGNKAAVRIIIDNFQLIQNPIYGRLLKNVNKEEWDSLRFDLADWKGHKAYIEILPGVSNRHHYKLPIDAYVEVQYAIGFNGDWPKDLKYKSESKKSNPQVSDWSSYKSTPELVSAINQSLKAGRLNNDVTNMNELLTNKNELVNTLVDTTFFVGINEGFGINSPIFVRGSHTDVTEEKIPRGFLSAVTQGDPAFKTAGSGRMELAESILNSKNPLTSRVMVNRIWHHLFGKGIVETVDNFGLQGKLPSHPKMLDYLAVKFQEDGWSIKSMIKFIVMSNTFQGSTTAGLNTQSVDPNNLLLSHFPVRRLEAEAIWDGILASSGRLDFEMYGEPVPVYLTKFMQGRGRPGESGPLDGDGRRSVYQNVRRNFLQPMMLTFDRPIPFAAFGKRNVTNVPAQSLVLMNDPFVLQQSELLAKEVMNNDTLNKEERFKYIYTKLLTREPTEEEIAKANNFIELLTSSYSVENDQVLDNLDIWRDYCHSVFNLKEFIYLI
ncbi:MAG: hypothetical protein ACJA2S_003597 [Cyclobacteriaceae bacterium]|jgi:hypothetical protein